jgi:thiol-disulfide isomerase/thioredoxin
MKKAIIIFLAMTLWLLALGGCGKTAQPEGTQTSEPQENEETSTPVESSEPQDGAGIFSSFTAEDLEGNVVDQSVFEDHTLTMVNIWATFCSPCLKEMPDLGELHQEYADQGFQVLGIVIDVLNQDGSVNSDQLETAQLAVEETGANYIHLLPSEDLIMAKLQYVTGVPETIFVDAQGNQVGESYMGSRSKEAWAEIIETLLSEM